VLVPNSLVSPPVSSLLDRLFRAAEQDGARRADVAGRYPNGFATASAREQADPVGFILLDGWKDLYLPVLRLLEPRLVAGALVVADDTISMAAEMRDYLTYVRDPARGYLSIA
jgi:predicted O-methyltransferase YrrM